jgi:hypothetical protein
MKTKIQIATILFLTLVILSITHVRFAYSDSLRFNPEPITGVKWTLYPVDMPNHSKDQISYINYAYRISDNKDFIFLLKAENGNIDPYRRHNPSKNVVGVDWGFCGINDYWHAEIVNDPRFFDWQWQIEKCLELYKRGEKFYGLSQIHKVKHNFEFND